MADGSVHLVPRSNGGDAADDGMSLGGGSGVLPVGACLAR